MAEKLYAKVGAAIRAKRSEAGMTQASLASRTGLKRTSITNIERGSQAILLHQLIDVARVLRTDPVAFLEGLDETSKESAPVKSECGLTDLLKRLDKPVQARRR